MNASDFELIKKFIKDQAAIVLEPGKEYLVEARLTPIAIAAGFASLDALINSLRFTPSEEIKLQIVDALTINETLFFRDIHPFEMLKTHVLPEIILKKQHEKKINIWCAASSSGQEPYTIAMILKEHAAILKDWTVNFIASDISDKMLARAKSGIYNQLEVNRGLPTAFLVKYFEKTGAGWQINQELRDMVQFQKINLMKPWSLPYMDLVFMRNVLIYFGVDTKKDIFTRIEKTLHPDGYFFLGGAETTLGINNEFERVGINKVPCYKLKKDRH